MDILKKFLKTKTKGEELGKVFLRFKEFLKSYYDAKRNPESLTDIINILKRYNFVWGSEECIETEDMPGFTKFFSTREALEKIRPFLGIPFFYRMNFINQLSTTSFWRYLEASHSRLAHALGTVQSSQKFIDAIRKTREKVEDFEEVAVLVYAFIHDCYHGPFGHSLEFLRELFIPAFGERLDKFYLSEALRDKDSSLRKALEVGLHMVEKEKILNYLEFFAERKELKDKFKERYFLAQIVDSRFDADRIDYLLRDSLHLDYHGRLNANVIENVIQGIRVLPYKCEEDGDEETYNRLVLNIKDKNILEEFIYTRRELYTKIYENPEKIIFDEMLAHVIYYALCSKEGFERGLHSSGDNLSKQIILEVNKLVDDQLIHFLFETGGPDFAQWLLRSLLINNPWVEIDKRGIKYFEIENVTKKVSQMRKKYKELLNQKIEEEEKKRGILVCEEDISHREKVQLLRLATPPPEDKDGEKVLEFYFAFIVSSGGFEMRHKLEGILWKKLLEDEKFMDSLKGNYIKEFGDIHEDVMKEFMEYPHIHISVPTYVSMYTKDLEEYVKEWGTETLLFYNESDYKPQKVRLDLPAKIEEIYFCDLILSGPKYFAKEEQIKQMIVKTFDKILKDYEWLWEARRGTY